MEVLHVSNHYKNEDVLLHFPIYMKTKSVVLKIHHLLEVGKFRIKLNPWLKEFLFQESTAEIVFIQVKVKVELKVFIKAIKCI